MNTLMPGLDAASNLHPVLVHFPIALWPLALVVWLLGEYRESDHLRASARWTIYLAAATSIIAAGSGLWATSRAGHDTPGHDLVHVHRNYMLVASGTGLLLAGLVFRLRAGAGRLRWVLAATLGAVNLITVMGADRGALLVYGYGMGMTASPSPMPHERDAHGDEQHGSH